MATPQMIPAPGERLLRFVGDRLRISLRAMPGMESEATQFSARLRTNLGGAELLRKEIIAAHAVGLPAPGAAWRDIPMQKLEEGWSLELPLTDPGFFSAKAYVMDAKGRQYWPHGPDLGVSVHPDRYRTANIIYCAFPRLLGGVKAAGTAPEEKLHVSLGALEQKGYAILPPSGKLRDLTRQLPHIVKELGCRVLQLLPVHPSPVTFARFGTLGSPYAALDLTAIDPALVEFDRRTT